MKVAVTTMSAQIALGGRNIKAGMKGKLLENTFPEKYAFYVLLDEHHWPLFFYADEIEIREE